MDARIVCPLCRKEQDYRPNQTYCANGCRWSNWFLANLHRALGLESRMRVVQDPHRG
jgi:hypothetical protein